MINNLLKVLNIHNVRRRKNHTQLISIFVQLKYIFFLESGLEAKAEARPNQSASSETLDTEPDQNKTRQ